MKRLMLLVMCAFVAGKAFAATPTLYKTLETDGRGFILTDYQPKTDRSRIEYDLRFLYLGLPFGLGIANGTSSAGATNDKEWGGYFNAETRTFTYYTEPGNACANFGEGFCDTSVRHTVSMGLGKVALDSQTNVIATTADDYTTGGRFALFAANFGGTTFSAKAVVRVAGIRIFENDTLVRDWVPAKDANGTATLYDLVNGKFETVKAGVFSVDDTVDPTWEVQAANGWTVQPTVPASIAAGTLPTISLGTAEFGDGTQTATYTAKDIQNLPAGTYTQIVEVKSTAGYRGLRKELTFTVTGTVPTAASVAPTAVAPLGGASVATHTAKQKEFIGLPAATRKRVLSVLYERERAEYAANDGRPQPVRLRWDGGDGACTIHVYRGNETTPVQTHTVVTRWTDGNFFDLDNLEIGQAYRWTVTNAKGEAEGSFVTEDETPRLLNAGVVGNTRDLGGYVGLDGRRVRQGMFLRSRCFDTNERTTYGSVLTATEEAFFRDFIGLKTEIDLRGDTWITNSFVPGVTTRVNTAWPLDYTGSYLTDATKKSAMKAALNPIFDAAKYPIDVHCHSGQDRTGMYCFILEALLGVSEADCIRDWEWSALGNSGFNASDTYQLDSFLEKFRSLNGATTQAKAETFMKWLGYSSTLIDAFREIMLEPIGGDEPDDLVMVTFGDHPHMTAAWTGGDGSVTNAVDGADFRVEEGTTNVRVIFTADPGWEIVGDAVVELGTVTEDIDFGEESGYEVPTVRRAAVKYIDADGVEQAKSAGEFDVVTEETRFLTNGWYVVLDDIDIAAKTNIVVQGDVHLILCDGASLTVTNAPMHCAAVSVGTNTTLAIYGQTEGTGRLTAKGGAYAPGIGGGHTGDGCGAVAIHGGTITANGGTNAAGIGGCYKSDGGSVTITGGRIAAAAKSASAADIGNGALAKSDCGVSISGGVFANPVETTWCAEGYASVANPDPATAADYPYTVRPAYRVSIGEHPNVAAAWTCGDGSVTNEIDGVSFAVMPPGTNGVQVIFTAEPGWVLVGDAVVDVGEVAGDIAFGDDFRVPGVQREPVAYVDADGEERSKAGDEFEVVTSETRFLASGWYVVLDDVEIRAKTNLTVVGDAHLILCDGASLTVANAQSDTAGIAVGGGASLAIYGQAEDTGRLDVTGGVRASGIGGIMDGDCGAIAINGGSIVANGGFSGAGIGSGLRGSGGSVSITGGRIRATAGSDFAPDIGSGSDAVTNCAVSISGGVFARELKDAWLAPGFAAVTNTDAATKDEYPWALAHPVFVMVTFGDHAHLTVAWTSGDGSVTNAVGGTFFRVPVRTTNVKVVFTAEPGWEIVGEAVVNLGTVTEDTVFGDGNDYRAPEARDVCGWCGIDGEAWYFRGGVSLWRIEAAYNEGVMSLRQRNADASGTLDLWGIERALADVGIGPVSDATLTFESTWGTNGFANVTELIITNRHFAANYPVGSLKPFAGISRLVLGDGETDLTVGSNDDDGQVVQAKHSVFGTDFDALGSVEIRGRDVRLRNAFCCYAATATARLADVRVHATGNLDLGWNSFNVSTGSKGGTISNAVFEAGGGLHLGGRALRYSLVSNALVSVSAPPGAQVVLGGPHFIGQYNKKMPVTLDWYAPPPVVEDPSALCDSTITWRFPAERAEEYAGIFQGREKFVTISNPGCCLSVALPPSESADSIADRRDKYGSWQQLKTAGTDANNDGGGTAYWHRFVRIEPEESPILSPGGGKSSFTFRAETPVEMDAALRSVRIETPEPDIISGGDYARYFILRTEPLGNNRYQLTAVLDPGAVEVESVVRQLAAQLPCETASLAGSPGLWYFVEQAERLEDLGKSFSKPVQANRDGTFSLELAPLKDSSFYRLHVKASEFELSADR